MPTKSKSPIKSLTSKQKDKTEDSMQLLQTKNNKIKTLDDISQDNEYTFGPNIKYALVKKRQALMAK